MSLHFVLDGYNLIKKSPQLALMKLEAGREALIALIEQKNLQGSHRNPVTIVFDGKMFGDDIRHVSGLRVIFTSHESADDRIKTIVDDADNPKNIVVVTDDREIRYYVRSLGARLMTTQEFLQGKGPAKHSKPEHKTISHVQESKITSELSKIWLKNKK